MADIFLSYKRTDRERTAPIVALLEASGWSVWWDTRIDAGEHWDEIIEREINAASCVVAVWSFGSVTSRWVKIEASEGLERGILVPVFIDPAKPPLEFKLVQSLFLVNWQGDTGDPAARALVAAVERFLGPASSTGRHVRTDQQADVQALDQERSIREEEHWELIRKSRDRRQFSIFLATYPNGHHAVAANAMLAQLALRAPRVTSIARIVVPAVLASVIVGISAMVWLSGWLGGSQEKSTTARPPAVDQSTIRMAEPKKVGLLEAQPPKHAAKGASEEAERQRLAMLKEANLEGAQRANPSQVKPAIDTAPRPRATSPPAKRGGILKFVVADEPPGFDGHRETTFALIHPIAPFYSTLIRANPENPAAPDDFVCDICTEVPKAADGGKSFTFKIRSGIRFHDGTPLTAKDVLATFQRIVFPRQGISSPRRTYFSMVESVTAPDDETVVFKLKYPSGAFIPSLAMPYNFIYSKAKLDADPHWYEQNVMGSGPFVFEERQAGAFIKGRRNPSYYHAGKPYLDGFEAIFAKTQTLRLVAIRGDQAAVEFRGFPPKSRDDLVAALGRDITVQESDWNCALVLTPNQKRRPFDDVRVRRALTLAVDRWGGSQTLSKIAIVRTVGGMVFPGHPLATPKAELEKLAGYWPNISKSREEAKRLLKEAGVSNLKFTLSNRAVDQPYTIVGTWLIDQWTQAGLAVDQKLEATGPFYAALRDGAFDVALEFNCQPIVNPLVDVSRFLPDAGDQYGGYQDPELNRLHDAMNRTGDVAEQKNLMHAFEKRVLDEQAHNFIILWWYRIVAHRSYLHGWKITPSHYLNQDLSTVWLDK